MWQNFFHCYTFSSFALLRKVYCIICAQKNSKELISNLVSVVALDGQHNNLLFASKERNMNEDCKLGINCVHY